MNQTTNYKLNLPEGRDVADISKLNANFTKLDSQLKSTDNRVTSVSSQLSSSNNNLQSSINSVESSLQTSINNCKPISGTFTGDGSSSRTITLGFRPSVVFVLSLRSGMYYNCSSIATSDTSGRISDGTLLYVTSSGFTVYYQTSRLLTNVSGHQYLYVAWK